MLATLSSWLSKETFVWRAIAAPLILTGVGGAWDVWWHRMVGRDSFWEPPHIMIYGGVMLAVALGFAAWRIHRNTLWRNIALALLAIPLVVAPFDEVWHAIFGKEDITSVWIIWSPPHVALVLAIVWAFVLLLPFLRKEELA